MICIYLLYTHKKEHGSDTPLQDFIHCRIRRPAQRRSRGKILDISSKKKELTLHGVILKGHVAQKCHWCRPVIVFHVSFPNEIIQSTKLLVVGTYAVAMSTPTVLAAA